VLDVDRTPPQISNVRASNAVLGGKATVSFAVSSPFASRFIFVVTITGPDGMMVYRSPQISCPAGPQGVYWAPAATAIPGSYAIDVSVWDEAGNPADAQTSSLVV
jgi:hypothetical protein